MRLRIESDHNIPTATRCRKTVKLLKQALPFRGLCSQSSSRTKKCAAGKASVQFAHTHTHKFIPLIFFREAGKAEALEEGIEALPTVRSRCTIRFSTCRNGRPFQPATTPTAISSDGSTLAVNATEGNSLWEERENFSVGLTTSGHEVQAFRLSSYHHQAPSLQTYFAQ